MTDLPAPLVPPECTMAGNDWFPLHFDRLRRSKWWRRATDLARARNVMLWGEAYKQVPAGSLPDDDDDLAEAAGFGMDVDAFLAAKAEIMAPWTKCSDGRWYHPTVCDVVLEAWERASERKKAAAERQQRRRQKIRGVTDESPEVTQRAAPFTRDSENVTRDSAEKPRDFGIQTRQYSTDPPLPPEGEGELFGEVKSPPQIDEVLLAFDLWNDTADRCGLPKAKVLDESRRRAIRKRLEVGGLDMWRQAMEAVEASAFLRGLRIGGDGRAFRADLTFVCQAKSFGKLVDGAYGQDADPPARMTASAVPHNPWRARVREFKANIYWNELDWGPKPGRPGCKAPPEIQREFGFEPAPPQPVEGRAA